MEKTRLIVLMISCVWIGACSQNKPGEQEKSLNPLQGVWKVVEERDLSTGIVEQSMPAYQIFTERCQMVLSAEKNRPKIEKSFKDMTQAEIRSQLPVGAGFLEYHIEGNHIVRTTKIALSAYYEGQVYKTEFEIRGDTLILRDSHLADGHTHQWTLLRLE